MRGGTAGGPEALKGHPMSQHDTDKCFTPFDGERAISGTVRRWRCDKPNLLRSHGDAYTVARERPDTFSPRLKTHCGNYRRRALSQQMASTT